MSSCPKCGASAGGAAIKLIGFGLLILALAATMFLFLRLGN